MKKQLLLIAIVLSVLAAFSQHYQPTRVDIKVKEDWEKFKTFSCGENGVITYYHKNISNGKKSWHISFFNEELEEVWSKRIKTEDDRNIVEEYYDEDLNTAYILIADTKIEKEKKRFSLDDENPTNIIKIKPEKRSDKVSLIKHKLPISNYNYYKSFLVARDKLFIFLEQIKFNFFQKCCNPLIPLSKAFYDAPARYLFMLDTKENYKSKSIPIIHKGEYYAYQNAFKNEKDEIIFLANVKDPADSEFDKQVMYTIDGKNGEVKQKTWLNNDINVPVQYPGIIKHKGNKNIYIVMYGEEDNKEESGILMKHYEKNSLTKKKKYSLKELTGRDNRKGILGLFTVKVKTHMRFHHKTYSLSEDGAYMIVGERLTPYYETRTYYSNGQMRTERVHMGWNYHESYLMAFNKEDELLWHDTFDMNDYTFVGDTRLIPRLNVRETDNDEVTMMFAAGDKILSKVVEDAESNDRQEEFKLRSQYKESRIKGNYEPNIEHWYDKYFIASGYVDVKRSEFFLSGKDRVYYFTKVKYDN